MTKTQAKTTRSQMLSALNQAQDTEYRAAAKCCLETALVCCQALAKGGMLTHQDRAAVDQTFAALAPRGWSI